MNFVPFAEQVLDRVVELYRATSEHQSVINSHVLEKITKVGLSTSASKNFLEKLDQK